VVIDKDTHTNGQNRQDVAKPMSRHGSVTIARPSWARRAIARSIPPEDHGVHPFGSHEHE
jgi:hypothetical protein